MQVPIGVANSVSSNFGYDPLDAIHFAGQSNFDIIQLYLNEELLKNVKDDPAFADNLAEADFARIYFHAEGLFNPDFLQGIYGETFLQFLEKLHQYRLVIHFDENATLDDSLKLLEKFSRLNVVVYLENYFRGEGVEAAERNLRKYMALFTLANSQSVQLHPVLDIPRFFHRDLDFPREEALQWCFQLFNYFGNKRIPILFHLIDVKDAAQARSSFTAVGDGVLPYREIFDFLKKNRTGIEGIILEYEDKINPLKSRDKLTVLLADES